MFFFSKQKTAYEMRISDWSSDVCSSDLSRVGATISDRGLRALARPADRTSIIGSVKEAVLPVPVCAQPSTSRPIRTYGIAFSWIGVGLVSPDVATAETTPSERPRAEKAPCLTQIGRASW